MATPKFIPITLQLLFGDAKARLAELRNGLSETVKQSSGVAQATNAAFSNQSQSGAKNLSQVINEIAKNSSSAKAAVAAWNQELKANKSLRDQVAAKSQVAENKKAITASLKDQSGSLGGILGNVLGKSLPAELSGATAGLTGLAAVAGLAGTVFVGLAVALGGATLALAKQADELKLTAAVTGLSIQQLQTYQNAAKVTGNSVNALTDGVLQYRQRAKEALSGNFELSKSFTNLGIDLKTAVSNPSASFDALLDQLQALPNDVQRVNAIQKIFGETNRELTGIIISLTENQGELRKQLAATGNALDDQSVKSLARLNRDYELLTLKVENFAKRSLVSLYNTTELVNARLILTSLGISGLTSEQQKAEPAINATTGAIDNQAGAVAGLGNEISALQRISGLQKGLGDVIANIADKAKNSADAVKQFKKALALNDETFAANNKVKQFNESKKAIEEYNNPKPLKARVGGAAKPKELTEFQQLQKQLKEVNKDISSFQQPNNELKIRVDTKDPKELKKILGEIQAQERLLDLRIVLDEKEGLPIQTARQLDQAGKSIAEARAAFTLRFKLEDQRNLKNELESIIKLRRTLGEPVAVALPADLAGVDKEKGRLNELKQLKELSAKTDVFGPIRESFNATSQATAAQFQGLDKLINDALPKVEPATIAAALAQNTFYQSLLKTNPQLAEYYQRQAQAADATIRNTQATEQFTTLRDQLNGQLSQSNNLNAEQTLALRLQTDAYKDLDQAQRSQLLGLAQQIDQQDAFRAQIEESQRRTEAFANQLRGIFDRLLDGPKAFFDGLKNTLKRTLSQMLSDLLTSKVLKLLGLAPGGGAAGAGQSGFGGLAPALAGGNAGGGSGGGGIGSAITQAVTGGLGGGNSAALTGGFTGGNPAGSILNRVTGAGSSIRNFLTGGFSGGGNPASPASTASKIGDLPFANTSNLQNLIAPRAPGVGGLSAAGQLIQPGGLLNKIPLLGKASGFLSKIPGLGSLFGGGGAAAGGAAAGAGGAGAAGGAGGAALFSNPVTAIIGGALIAAPFILGLFADRTFNKFRNEVKKAYQIEVDKKQEGRSLFQSVEQIGKNVYGKDFKNKIPEVIQARPVKEQIAQYGVATGQDKSSLVRQFANKQKLGDPDDPQNQIVRREFGGTVRGGSPVLVGERRAEILVPGSDGFVFPSIAAYERQLIAALQKRAAGGFFGGAFGKLASQIEASAFSRSAGGSATTAGGGGGDNLMLGVLGELSEAVAGLKAIPAGHVVSQGLRDNPNLASRALAADIRSASPESKQIIKAAKGYK